MNVNKRWTVTFFIFCTLLLVEVFHVGPLLGPSYALNNLNLDSALVEKMEEPVDVIVIQSEAFMEFSKLKELKFSKEPLPYYKAWQKKAMYGELKVPVNGGLTCNSEFELLTGIRRTAIAANPFVDVIAKENGKVNSLAWRLKARGFNTLGIHPYESDYFNRDQVYPKLGIDQFISMSAFENPKKFGHWISDESDFNMVLSQLDLSSTNQFIFNVTVQNHAPFSYKSSNDLIQIDSKAFVNQAEKEALQHYATGLWYTDQALNDFLKTIEKRPRRTLVVFYGDHQPSKEHKSFANMAFFKSKGYYVTDYIIYDNKDQIEKGKKDLSLIQVGGVIESALGIKEETALNLYNEKYGYTNYDTLNLERVRALYLEENERLDVKVFYKLLAFFQNAW